MCVHVIEPTLVIFPNEIALFLLIFHPSMTHIRY